MGFLAPLALAFAALCLPILIFYMLKLRREEHVVSSTMLWQQVLRDQEANAPWQRLRRNLLLLLQLLLLFLLVMGLARPYSKMARTVQGNVIVLLDASASMQATDVSPSRFEAARSHARQIVDGLGPNDTMTLIAVGDTPHVLSSLTHDRSVLRRALATVRVTNAQADWEAAFILASSSARQALRSTIVILSDGGLPSDLPDLPGQVRYVPVGTTAENRAISALAIRDGPQGPQAFVRVSNNGTQPATSLVQVYTDGTLFDARSLSLAPGSESALALDDLPLDVRQIEARLAERPPRAGTFRRTGGDEDALSLDNTAWAVHPSADQATVLLATPGNTFLERALSLMPNLNLITVRVTQSKIIARWTLTNAQVAPLSPRFASLRPALHIFDGALPASLPESGNLFFIDPPTGAVDVPPASTELFAVTGSLTKTHVSHVEQDDPLLRYVDLGNLHVARARAIEPPPWARTLVETESGALLLAGEVNGRRIAILAFDLHHSDLPLQIAFPILMANLTAWLAPTSAVDVPALLSPGTPVMLRPQVGITELTVVSPSGQRWTFPIEGSEPIPFAQTHELGTYTVEQQSAMDFRQGTSAERPPHLWETPSGAQSIIETQFAVNLFSELESHIEPRDTILVGSSPIDGQATGTAGRREWWRWLALAGLIVLVVEWIVHHKVLVATKDRLCDLWSPQAISCRRWTSAETNRRYPPLR